MHRAGPGQAPASVGVLSCRVSTCVSDRTLAIPACTNVAFRLHLVLFVSSASCVKMPLLAVQVLSFAFTPTACKHHQADCVYLCIVRSTGQFLPQNEVGFARILRIVYMQQNMLDEPRKTTKQTKTEHAENRTAKCHAVKRTLASRKGCTGNLPSEFARPTTLCGRIRESCLERAVAMVLLML